jgi:hypothetical protein
VRGFHPYDQFPKLIQVLIGDSRDACVFTP